MVRSGSRVAWHRGGAGPFPGAWGGAPMSAATKSRRSGLTDYEAEQVRRIAAWKSEPPNPFGEMFKRVTLPGARFLERAIPDRLVDVTIERAYAAADLSTG